MIQRCQALGPSHAGPRDDRRHHHRRSRSAPVRDDLALPLPVRPLDPRHGAARRRDADDLVPRGQRSLAAPRAVLRDADADQLRDRGRDRARAGVPVRDELVDLLGVRGRRVRRAARDRRARGVHARVDLPRALDLRLGSAVEARPPRHDLALRARKLGVGVLHHRGQLLDAASGRLGHRRRPGRADEASGSSSRTASRSGRTCMFCSSGSRRQPS